MGCLRHIVGMEYLPGRNIILTPDGKQHLATPDDTKAHYRSHPCVVVSSTVIRDVLSGLKSGQLREYHDDLRQEYDDALSTLESYCGPGVHPYAIWDIIELESSIGLREVIRFSHPKDDLLKPN